MESLQRAIKENKLRENVRRFKEDEGMLRFHDQSKKLAVQVSVGNCLFKASDLAGLAGIQDAKGNFKLVFSVGCCLCSAEIGTGTVGRGRNSVGGRLKTEKPSFAALPQAAGISAIMVRPRERMLSRRGSVRGGSSRHPAAESHHHCCCCYCHRRAGANPIQASQFMDASNPNPGPNPLPAFGSAIFTLGSSRDNSRINAHISVLFIEETQEGEGGSGSKEELPGESLENDEDRLAGAPEQTPNFPQEQEASTSKKIMGEDWDALREHYAWCRILEEKPEE